jgi:uncharacterized protein with PQ loop repeat
VSLQETGVVAGSISTTLFVISYLPMLVKAVRTRDLRSYSAGNLVVANVGNVVHSVYVFSLPAGPLWPLHSFYVVSSALMLFWWWRYRSHHDGVVPAEPGAGHPGGAPVGDEVPEDQGHGRLLEPAAHRARDLGAAAARARLDDALDPGPTSLLVGAEGRR